MELQFLKHENIEQTSLDALILETKTLKYVKGNPWQCMLKYGFVTTPDNNSQQLSITLSRFQ